MAGGIPDDVLFEILIRLPVKSLCRFRLVCPSWLSIISSPYFIRCHYSHSKTRTRLLVLNSFFISWKKWLIYDADHMELDLPELVRAGQLIVPSWYDPTPSVQYGRIWSRLRGPRVAITGSWHTFRHHPTQSVHGLICLPLEQDGIGILNPSTGENILISHPQVTRGYRERYYFGFDPVSEKHKVFYTCQTPKQYLEQWVYTLGSVEKWRRVGVPNHHHRNLKPYEQVCIEGILYFRVAGQGHGFKGLASFDLKSESFRMVELSFTGMEPIESYVLIEFNGSVALVDHIVSDSNPPINVWVMEDFHKQVWKLKRSVLVPDLCWKTLASQNPLEFGCTLHGGELLVFTPFRPEPKRESGYCDLFSWNTVINDFRRSRIHVREGNTRFNWSEYQLYSDNVESLLPLKAP